MSEDLKLMLVDGDGEVIGEYPLKDYTYQRVASPNISTMLCADVKHDATVGHKWNNEKERWEAK